MGKKCDLAQPVMPCG